MNSFLELSLMSLPYVSSSYTNMWWSEALRLSTELNGGHKLSVLTEEQVTVDVAKSGNTYIPHPVFVDGFKPTPGFYHLNVQGSSKSFVGWMWVKEDDTIAWWGQSGNDAVNAGTIGVDACFPEWNTLISCKNWIDGTRYVDKFPQERPVWDVLRYV